MLYQSGAACADLLFVEGPGFEDEEADQYR